jgi:glycosyltransferase involved in cell wall biosynthesis
MKATRVVALLHGLSLTGAPRLTLDILGAVRDEAAVRIVSWEGGPLIDEARDLGPSAVLRDARATRLLPRRLATGHMIEVLAGATARIAALGQGVRLRRWKPDLIYISSVPALPLVRMLRLADAPTVLHVHELGSALASFERDHPGLILTVPDRYVADSAAVKRDLIQLGVPADAVSVVPPYLLPLVQAAPEASRASGPGRLIVGGAGNPSWTKGIDLWLLAAREAVDLLGPDRLRFVWVGYRDNEAGAQFRTMISKLGLDDVVELVPSPTQIHDHFARFDVFAMASWEDSFPLVVLEAMAMGVPVVCFAPTGGPAEEVGDAGIVIPEISPRHMAEAIADLARSPDRRRALGTAGAERVREEFPRARSLAALVEVFDTAVSSGGRRGPHSSADLDAATTRGGRPNAA